MYVTMHTEAAGIDEAIDFYCAKERNAQKNSSTEVSRFIRQGYSLTLKAPHHPTQSIDASAAFTLFTFKRGKSHLHSLSRYFSHVPGIILNTEQKYLNTFITILRI